MPDSVCPGCGGGVKLSAAGGGYEAWHRPRCPLLATGTSVWIQVGDEGLPVRVGSVSPGPGECAYTGIAAMLAKVGEHMKEVHARNPNGCTVHTGPRHARRPEPAGVQLWVRAKAGRRTAWEEPWTEPVEDLGPHLEMVIAANPGYTVEIITRPAT